MLAPESSAKRRRIRIVVAVVVFFVAFALGIVIGYVAIKLPEESKEQNVELQGKKADLQKRHEEMMSYHKKFQTTVSEEDLEKTLK